MTTTRLILFTTEEPVEIARERFVTIFENKELVGPVTPGHMIHSDGNTVEDLALIIHESGLQDEEPQN
jgi:hypothetical protein